MAGDERASVFKITELKIRLTDIPKNKRGQDSQAHSPLCPSSNPGELSANGPRQISSYHCSLQHWGFFRSIYVFAQGLKSSPANSPKTQSHVLLTAGEKIASYQRCCMLLPWSVCCDIVWRSSCLSFLWPVSSQRAWQQRPRLKVSGRQQLQKSLHSTGHRQERHEPVTHQQKGCGITTRRGTIWLMQSASTAI